MNDKCTVKPNIIFDTLILKDTGRAHTKLKITTGFSVRFSVTSITLTQAQVSFYSTKKTVSTRAY